MAISIRREGSNVSELQSTQINSTKSNTEEKTSKIQEVFVTESISNEKQSLSAKNLANAKRADDQLHALSIKMQLDAAEKNAVTVSKSANNLQTLGQSGTEKGSVVSQQYAVQKNSSSQAEKNSYESIRKEIAGALGISESDPVVDETYVSLVVEQRDKLEGARQQLEADRLKNNQEIFDAALALGRREETTIPGLPGWTIVKEIVPGKLTENLGDIEQFLRLGFEFKDKGEITRTMKYFEPGKFYPMGIVESIIKDGKETITKVIEKEKGAMGLKEGDTRDVLPQKKSAAGLVPSSFDPQPDGRYGSAGKPTYNYNNDSNYNNTNNNSNSDASNQKPESSNGVGRFADTDSAPVRAEKSSGERQPSSSGTSTEKVHVYHSSNNGQTWEDKGTQWTETPPTQVEVEEPKQQTEQTEKPQTEKTDAEKPAAEGEKADNDEHQAAYGDYAEIGPAPPPQSQLNQSADKVSSHSSKQNRPIKSYVLRGDQVNGDLNRGPMDFGNGADPDTIEAPQDMSKNPLVKNPTVTDPANPGAGEETILNQGSIHIDMSGSLKDGLNPLDAFENTAPEGSLPNTSDSERSS